MVSLLTYTLVAGIAYAGFGCGILLAHLAKEEMQPGKPYLELLGKILLLVLIAVMMNSMGIIWWQRIVIYGLTIAYLTFRTPTQQQVSAVLGVIFFLANTDELLFTQVSSLIFLYGLPAGSLSMTHHLKKVHTTPIHIRLQNSLFLLIAFSLAFISFVLKS